MLGVPFLMCQPLRRGLCADKVKSNDAGPSNVDQVSNRTLPLPPGSHICVLLIPKSLILLYQVLFRLVDKVTCVRPILRPCITCGHPCNPTIELLSQWPFYSI